MTAHIGLITIVAETLVAMLQLLRQRQVTKRASRSCRRAR
jgi:hypothetical protein